MEGQIPQWLRNTSLWHNLTAQHRLNRAENTAKDLSKQFKINSQSERDAAKKIYESPVFQYRVNEPIKLAKSALVELVSGSITPPGPPTQFQPGAG